MRNKPSKWLRNVSILIGKSVKDKKICPLFVAEMVSHHKHTSKNLVIQANVTRYEIILKNEREVNFIDKFL